MYQRRICSDSLTCCHTEIEVADQTFYLTQSQYTDTGPTNPSADPMTPGVWQGSHWECQILSHWYDSTRKKSRRKRDSNPGSSALEADALTTRPPRRFTVTTRHCVYLVLFTSPPARSPSYTRNHHDKPSSEVLHGPPPVHRAGGEAGWTDGPVPRHVGHGRQGRTGLRHLPGGLRGPGPLHASPRADRRPGEGRLLAAALLVDLI